MSCTSVDLKAYFLGELDPRQKAVIENHAGVCQTCREEMERLSVTQAALLTLPQEEAPRRIAFVSDKVFEPRWWQSIWRSGPAMGFASAALLAAAILVHAATRPAQVIAPASTVDTARIERQIQQEVDQRLDAAVTKAVAGSEARQAAQTAQMLAAAEKRFQQESRDNVTAMQQVARYYEQKMNQFMVASNSDFTANPRSGQ